MAEAAARLIVLGMDAANPGLVRRWAAEGRLPSRAALMARGVQGDVASAEGFFVGDPLLAVYAGVDRAIGEIVAAAAGATGVVFAAHGMAHGHGAHFFLRDILVRLGVTRAPAPAWDAPEAGHPLRAVRRSLPGTLRTALTPLRSP